MSEPGGFTRLPGRSFRLIVEKMMEIMSGERHGRIRMMIALTLATGILSLHLPQPVIVYSSTDSSRVACSAPGGIRMICGSAQEAACVSPVSGDERRSSVRSCATPEKESPCCATPPRAERRPRACCICFCPVDLLMMYEVIGRGEVDLPFWGSVGTSDIARSTIEILPPVPPPRSTRIL